MFNKEIMTTQAIKWSEIYQLRFVQQDQCWTTCGSYCCTHNKDDLGAIFLRNGAGMVFFDQEYEFLKQNNLLQQGFEDKAKKWEFKVNDSLAIKFYTSKCALMGKCSIPDFRPLICKIYPYVPQIDLETFSLIGFSYSSIIDQLWGITNQEHPCTLVRERSDIIQNQIMPSFQKLITYPYFIFYFKCAELFLQHIKKGMELCWRENNHLSIFQFSRKWEYEFLSNKALNLDELRQDVFGAYQKIKLKTPNFTI